jgi:Periplasmic binding protein
MSDRIPFRTTVVALVAVAVLAAGCGGGDKTTATTAGAGGGTAGATTSTTVPCPGDPIRMTSIGTLTGPLVSQTLVTEAKNGLDAALKAVNGACALGRPLDIVLCDEKNDPNESTRCGREAKDDGSIALFGSSGGFDGGSAAAGLPGVMTAGANVFDLTNAQSFPSSAALTLVVGGAATAAAAHITDALMVSIDSAATRTFVATAQEVAQSLGVKLDTLFVAPDTTDFAPIAAQITAKHPSGLGLILTTQMVPFMNALASEGITPADTPIFTAVTLMSPEVLKQLGHKADGVYLLTQQAPPSDSTNPGIEQMLKELKAAGVDTSPDDMSPAVTGAWSNVHALVDILQKLPPADLASLDAAKLVAAMQNAGPIDRPEVAPFDFTKNVFPDVPTLSGFRIFAREAMLVRVEDGTYKRATDFSDATKPFKIDS